MGKELKKILLIDDDKDIHIIVKFSLRDLPEVELSAVLSGEEGVKAAMDLHPDLILLDVMMPDMDGIATLQAIKLFPSLANTPVIFLTAKAQKNEVEEYYKHGVLDVIVKPFDPTTFSTEITKLWKKHLDAQVKP